MKTKTSRPKEPVPTVTDDVLPIRSSKPPQVFKVWELDEEWMEAVRNAEPPAFTKQFDHEVDDQ